MQIPADVRGVIEEIVARIPPAALRRAVAAMTAHYRGHGRTGSLDLAAEERLAAYLVTRLPATYAAARAAMREVYRRVGDAPIVSMLDLGAGAGAATLAARRVFPALGRCTLIERDRAFAGVAGKLVPGADVRVADVRRFHPPDACDLVVMGYMLGELPERDRHAMVERAWQAARVALLVLEPGSPAGFEIVRLARDQLLRSGARMIAPCPGEGSCPMPPGDWCHFGQRVERSSLHRRMKGGTLGYEDEKFSYVALARQEVHRAQARIIRRPAQSPGLVHLTLCSGAAILSERISRRNPALFRAARQAGWGDEWRPCMMAEGDPTCS
ncbi:MAG: small ribosomal subunit Rsm22 family protein [Bryobacteraceae bacterium]